MTNSHIDRYVAMNIVFEIYFENWLALIVGKIIKWKRKKKLKINHSYGEFYISTNEMEFHWFGKKVGNRIISLLVIKSFHFFRFIRYTNIDKVYFNNGLNGNLCTKQVSHNSIYPNYECHSLVGVYFFSFFFDWWRSFQ